MNQPDTVDSLERSLVGDREARARLLEELYDDLHRMAKARMAAEPARHTLQPTALVHEAFLRLVDQRRIGLEGRTHFFALAAMSMRRVLVDHARAKFARKRNRGQAPETIPEDAEVEWRDPTEFLALHEALEELERSHPRQARAVELRFFGGLSLEEAGMALGISEKTAKIDWRFARAWLNRKLRDSEESDSE